MYWKLEVNMFVYDFVVERWKDQTKNGREQDLHEFHWLNMLICNLCHNCVTIIQYFYLCSSILAEFLEIMY